MKDMKRLISEPKAKTENNIGSLKKPTKLFDEDQHNYKMSCRSSLSCREENLRAPGRNGIVKINGETGILLLLIFAKKRRYELRSRSGVHHLFNFVKAIYDDFEISIRNQIFSNIAFYHAIFSQNESDFLTVSRRIKSLVL